MKAAVIIVAAGAGKRFGNKTPKQFLPLLGKPLYLWSVLAFRKVKEIKQVIVVVPGDRIKILSPISKKYGFDLVPGGKERSDSVQAGLSRVHEDIGIVAIHDGARPLIRKETILNSLTAAQKYGAAVVAVQARDTVKLADGDLAVEKTIPRAKVWLAQTPQVFKKQVIQKAYNSLKTLSVTDDAQAAELSGQKVRIVPGDYSNIKITEAADLKIAKKLAGF